MPEYEQLQFPGMEDPKYKVVQAPFDMDPTKTLERRLSLLEDLVAALASELEEVKARRPGPKPAKLVAPKQPGVCAIDPDCDSYSCDRASIYRHQQGCRGTACVIKNNDYYADRRSGDRPDTDS
mgnify:CR=1 FL=1